ncbi:MAG: ParA family protein [Candidatus Dojkabacteria bacterium]
MIISFANQKGGVGKTTTTLSLASLLADKKRKVLAIDLDPQSNLTSGVGFDKTKQYKSSYDILIGDDPIASVYTATDIDNLYLVPSHIDLAASEIELVPKISRETILKQKLLALKEDFDYILIDCPPSLGLLTVNALAASDGIVIPVQCEYYALEGISQLLNTVHLVQNSLNKNLEIIGVVMTMFDARTKLSYEVVNEVKSYFKHQIFNTIIPRNIRVSESPSFGKPIDKYDASSVGARSYMELTREFIARVEQ